MRDLISDHFSPGELAPVQLVVDTKGKDIPVTTELKKLSFVDQVTEPIKGKQNSRLQMYEVSLRENPYSIEGMNKIPELRKSLKQIMKKSEINDAENHIWIRGETASLYDTKQTTERDQDVIIPVMIGIIALLLLVYLRSIVAMIYLILTVVLSFFSALGAGYYFTMVWMLPQFKGQFLCMLLYS